MLQLATTAKCKKEANGNSVLTQKPVTTVTKTTSDNSPSRNWNSSNSGGCSSSSSNNGGSSSMKRVVPDAVKEQLRAERQNLVLWLRPLTTLEYFAREVLVLCRLYGGNVMAHRRLVACACVVAVAFAALLHTNGPHAPIVQPLYRTVVWCLYWIGLGILSSVGLGTGLHTFLLYLGPHIAQVTLAAYECGSLDFPQPPYPDDIICPKNNNGMASIRPISILAIMAKVRLEAMCWGAGTALGELPPYFMARAARLSGLEPSDDDDDELRAFEELQRKQRAHNTELTWLERGKLFVEELVQRVGFFGILACASIPNPLFDLAGITCGHFLVPFWTFFGATLLGKALIKMHIQKLFVIIAFNETLIVHALDWLRFIPLIGEKLQTPFKQFLDGQKSHLHRNRNGGGGSGGAHRPSTAKPSHRTNLLGAVFEKFVTAMILYFLVSIVNAFAQNYHKRLHRNRPRTKKVGQD